MKPVLSQSVRRPNMDEYEQWPPLAINDQLTCVKVAYDGDIVTTYPVSVISAGAIAPWIAVQAVWKNKIVEQQGLFFMPGDHLHEFFSPIHPFNVFSVYSPTGELRGWYANVTFPTVVASRDGVTRLYWHDLFLDVVALPDGSVAVLDEDELEEAGLAQSAPELFEAIIAAKNELVRLAELKLFPFHETSIQAG